MFALLVLACVAYVSAAPGGLVASPLIATPYAHHGLGAPLLSKVNIAPAQVTVVKQPYVVQQPELVYRNVPVPIKAVHYTAPQVVHAAPVVHAHPVAYHAAPVVHHAAPVVHHAVGYHAAAHPVAYNHGFVKIH